MFTFVFVAFKTSFQFNVKDEVDIGVTVTVAVSAALSLSNNNQPTCFLRTVRNLYLASKRIENFKEFRFHTFHDKLLRSLLNDLMCFLNMEGTCLQWCFLPFKKFSFSNSAVALLSTSYICDPVLPQLCLDMEPYG
uniref:Uncharacterized protein n=1 Tax=Glossina palpalis gambiensis TaxID=67801 RepID=A0A1B0BNC0_9MUSC